MKLSLFLVSGALAAYGVTAISIAGGNCSELDENFVNDQFLMP